MIGVHEDNNIGALSVIKDVFIKNNYFFEESLLFGFAGGASYHLIEKVTNKNSMVKTYYVSSYPYNMLQNICINFGIHHEIWDYKLIERNKEKIANKLEFGVCLFVNEIMSVTDMEKNFCYKWGNILNLDADLLTVNVRMSDKSSDEEWDICSKKVTVHCLHFPEITQKYNKKLKKIIYSNSFRFLHQKEENWNISGINNLLNNFTEEDIVIEHDFVKNDMNRKLYSKFINDMCLYLEDSFYEKVSKLYIKSSNLWKVFFTIDESKICKISCLKEIYELEKKANELLMEH